MEAHFLLIKDSYQHWGFPKGHLEEEETPAAAALRETAKRPASTPCCSTGRSGSSTGTSVSAGAPSTSTATSSSSSAPRATRCRRKTRASPIRQWLPLEQALEQLSYDNARGVLQRGGEMARTLVAVGAGRARDAAGPIAAEG